MKTGLKNLAARRIEVPEGEVGKAELLRVLRQIALSPASKAADRLRAVELLGKAIGLFQSEGTADGPLVQPEEDLGSVILRKLAELRPPERHDG